MVFRSMQTATMALLGIVGFTAPPTVAQQPTTGTKVVQFMGLEGVKAKSTGRLTLEGGNLQFTSSNAKARWRSERRPRNPADGQMPAGKLLAQRLRRPRGFA